MNNGALLIMSWSGIPLCFQRGVYSVEFGTFGLERGEPVAGLMVTVMVGPDYKSVLEH